MNHRRYGRCYVYLIKYRFPLPSLFNLFVFLALYWVKRANGFVNKWNPWHLRLLHNLASWKTSAFLLSRGYLIWALIFFVLFCFFCFFWKSKLLLVRSFDRRCKQQAVLGGKNRNGNFVLLKHTLHILVVNFLEMKPDDHWQVRIAPPWINLQKQKWKRLKWIFWFGNMLLTLLP